MQENLLWGLRGAIAPTVLYCLWAGVVYAVSGQAAFEAKHLRFGQVIVTYVAIGAICGGIVGLLRPTLQYSIGPYLAGAAAGAAVGAGLGVSIAGFPSHWQADNWMSSLFVAALAAILFVTEIRKVQRTSAGSPPHDR